MPANGRPNVVVVMTDQQRADLSRREGYPLDTTPALDALARRGIWFDHAYTSTPLCAPARVSLLTGRWSGAHHVRENAATGHAVYTRDLFDVMRERGYSTALIGKNHAHVDPDRLDHAALYMHAGGLGAGRSAEEKAFDTWLHDLHHRVAMEPTPFPLECQAPFRIVTEAMRWIESLRGAPFCLWLSFPEPHNPYQVPEPYWSMFPPEVLPPLATGVEALAEKSFAWQYLRILGEIAHPDYGASIPRARSSYHGMLRLIDDQVRRFLDGLEATGVREETIIVVLSDHGDYVGEYGLMRKGAEMPEVLMRIPLSISGPGITPRAEPHPAFVSIVDILPTVCDAVGMPAPLGAQGRSLWPFRNGAGAADGEWDSVYGEQGIGGPPCTAEDVEPSWPGLQSGRDWRAFDELNACTQGGSLRMVRKGNWKILLDSLGRGQLYDLAADPCEVDNRYGDPACLAIQADMLAELAAWMMRAQDPLPFPERGYRRQPERHASRGSGASG